MLSILTHPRDVTMDQLKSSWQDPTGPLPLTSKEFKSFSRHSEIWAMKLFQKDEYIQHNNGLMCDEFIRNTPYSLHFIMLHILEK